MCLKNKTCFSPNVCFCFSNLCLWLRFHFNRIWSRTQTSLFSALTFNEWKCFFHLVTSFLPLFQFFKHGKRELIISMLPVYSKCSYSEEDLVQLLTPFGFQHQAENIYILPQLRTVGPKWSSCLHTGSVSCLSPSCLRLQSLLYNAPITDSTNSESNYNAMCNLLASVVCCFY